MSPRFVLGRENVPCVAEVVNRSLKADCTDFKIYYFREGCFKTRGSKCKYLSEALENFYHH